MHFPLFSLSTSRSLVPRLLARLPRTRWTFTPEEVRERLRQDGAADPRTAAVHGAAAQTGLWSSLLPDKLAFELGRTASRLPTIVLWYRQGVPPNEIGRRLSPMGGAWDADRAIDVAMLLIATALNRPELVDGRYF